MISNPNNLYRNDGGRLSTSQHQQAWRIFRLACRSPGRIAGDGWMDLYVGNMFSSAGNRIAANANIETGMPLDPSTPCSGGISFSIKVMLLDISLEAGVTRDGHGVHPLLIGTTMVGRTFSWPTA